MPRPPRSFSSSIGWAAFIPSCACRGAGKASATASPPDIVTAVRHLALIANDDLIAGILNRNKLVTGHGNRWTRERVTALRSHHRIPVFRPSSDGIEPWLNLTNAAALLRVIAKTLRLAAECGEVDAIHPLADGPWLFSRVVLDEPPPDCSLNAQGAAPDTPQDHIPNSKTCSRQWHRKMGVMKRDCSRRARLRLAVGPRRARRTRARSGIRRAVCR